MAAALTMNRHDTARMETFNDSICKDSSLQKLCECVQVNTNPNLSETSAEVTVLQTNGKVFKETHDLLEPVDLPQRASRVRAKCESILGSTHAEDLWRKVAEGDTSPTQWMNEYVNGSATAARSVSS